MLQKQIPFEKMKNKLIKKIALLDARMTVISQENDERKIKNTKYELNKAIGRLKLLEQNKG